VLCDDWQRADDLVQATLTTLYVHWGRVRAASHPDAYARAVLVREFLHERRAAWVQRVSLGGRVSDTPAAAVVHDAALDLRAAALPARQRATLVLRLYCDLNVDQSAAILGCSPGTVKSQRARALDAVGGGGSLQLVQQIRTGFVP
jgi:RNA polymerase sigma factor (sigma-70 family)